MFFFSSLLPRECVISGCVADTRWVPPRPSSFRGRGKQIKPSTSRRGSSLLFAIFRVVTRERRREKKTNGEVGRENLFCMGAEGRGRIGERAQCEDAPRLGHWALREWVVDSPRSTKPLVDVDVLRCAPQLRHFCFFFPCFRRPFSPFFSESSSTAPLVLRARRVSVTVIYTFPFFLHAIVLARTSP